MIDPAMPPTAWGLALEAAALMAVDPASLGGVVLHARPGPARDRWLGHLRSLLPQGAAWRRIPHHVREDRLLGGLDLSATLQAGRPIAERGILAEADGGVVVFSMAERIEPCIAAQTSQVLDAGEVVVERDGAASRLPTRLGVVALDEGIDDERTPASLRERLAFHVDLETVALRDMVDEPEVPDVEGARARLAEVESDPEVIEALCTAAEALGIGSPRASQLALRAARAAAALSGRSCTSEEDACLAAALVLAPRARSLPSEAPPEDAEPPPPEPPDQDEDESSGPETGEPNLDDTVLAAANAALPPGLLDRIRVEEARRSASATPGKAGAACRSLRGRPRGVRPGAPGDGARLNLVETLRAAAPWQRLRVAQGTGSGDPRRRTRRIEVRTDDLRVTRFEQRSETTVIFVVDASGSSVLQRLAEVKGAIELLLADCYVRRDQVALIAFRGTGAELALPPTRSLVRAKRSLASLPGGGGTPLAAGLDAAVTLSLSVTRRGGTPLVVLLTDGRANIARDGSADRSRADEDAVVAARGLRSAGIASLLVDSSPRPRESAAKIAAEMAAEYLPLPHAGSEALCRAVRGATDAREMATGTR